MEVIEIIGYLGALLIGTVLGLIGGGGSILTVPIFVYLLSIDTVTATAYSLFVVGSTALVGAIRNMAKGLVNYKIAVVFAIPALIAVYFTRLYLVPAIPEVLFSSPSFQLTKSMGILLLFAIIMILAAASMIKNKKEVDAQKKSLNIPLIAIEGLVVGLLTGLVGAGGGFLIIPALVLLAGLAMKEAVATSLLIIAVKSLIGFIGDVQNLTIDWSFLISFTVVSIIGIFIGIGLNQFISGKKLKQAFGYFVLLMGFYIIIKELI